MIDYIEALIFFYKRNYINTSKFNNTTYKKNYQVKGVTIHWLFLSVLASSNHILILTYPLQNCSMNLFDQTALFERVHTSVGVVNGLNLHCYIVSTHLVQTTRQTKENFQFILLIHFLLQYLSMYINGDEKVRLIALFIQIALIFKRM